MIFVTVGTHEQQFNRLISAMDELKGSGEISEEVIIQTGYSDYEPKYCKFCRFYPYRQILEYVNEARIVVTHGGPSSFIMPLQVGKVPIVVPRQKAYDEHVNNHQVTFCRSAAERHGNIIVVEEVEKLGEAIKNYDSLVASISVELKSNNSRFCAELEKIAKEIVKDDEEK